MKGKGGSAMDGYIQYPNGPAVIFAENSAFVRRVKWDELEPAAQREVAREAEIYGVFDRDGEQMGLFIGSQLAFRRARQNDYHPTWMM